MIINELHISKHLGEMLKKWTKSNPEALRALKDFDEKNSGFLTTERDRSEELLKWRLSKYKCLNSGQSIDLYSIAKYACVQKGNLLK